MKLTKVNREGIAFPEVVSSPRKINSVGMETYLEELSIKSARTLINTTTESYWSLVAKDDSELTHIHIE